MLGTFLDKLSGFFDQRFLVAYWGPTFVGLGLAAGWVSVLFSFAGVLAWWTKRNTTEQVLLGVAALLAITVLAFLLGALTTPIIRLYEGYWRENALTRQSRKCWQETLKSLVGKLAKLEERLAQTKALTPDEERAYLHFQHTRYYNFPRDDARVKPTRLGNVLAAAEDYPLQCYEIDAVLWWPRLVSVLPDTFRARVDAALTPMVALLNLSTIFILLALGSVLAVLLITWGWWSLAILVVVILVGRLLGVALIRWPPLATPVRQAFHRLLGLTVRWPCHRTRLYTVLTLKTLLTLLTLLGLAALLLQWWFVAIFVGGLLLARACYLTAVSQAIGYGALVRVAFDLHRQEIFKQMHIPLPDNLVEERCLWAALNTCVYYYKMPWEAKSAIGVPLLAEPFYYDTHQPPAAPTQPQEVAVTIKDSPTLTLKRATAPDRPGEKNEEAPEGS